MGFLSSIGGFLKDTAGDLFSGGSNLVGGILGHSATKDRNDTSAALTREQVAYQKELAKNQIQWRVEDAKKAGLHPMAALGLSPTSFSPVSTSLSVPDYNFLSEFGQDVDRAIMQGKTAPERKKALELQETQSSLSIRNQELQNDLLETELADKRFRLQQQLFPSAPSSDNNGLGLIGGQDNAVRGTKLEPVSVSATSKTGQEPGANPSVGWIQNPDGTFSNVQSLQAKERLEDDFIGDIGWSVENRLFPHARWVLGMDNAHNSPPRSLLPKGAKGWRYTGWGSWRAVYD